MFCQQIRYITTGVVANRAEESVSSDIVTMGYIFKLKYGPFVTY